MATREYDISIQENWARANAQADYAELVKFLDKMARGMHRSRTTVTHEALKLLIVTFQQVADLYFHKAEALIQADQTITPLERSEKFYRTLEHLREHALLLADVIRFHSLKVFSKERREFLSKTIKFISQRLEGLGEPLLLPLFTPSFRYAYFRYMDNFGLIGIPPELAQDKGRNKYLSVLWHEVAGHAVAIARESYRDQVEAWATGLNLTLKKANHWDKYKQLFRQSVLENLPKKRELEVIGILSDFQDLYDRYIVTNDIIEKERGWQKVWLTEFLEDLFWIIVFAGAPQDEEAALQAMANALILRYPEPGIGDPKHPPLQLRLLVCSAYLAPQDSDRMKQLVLPYYKSKDRLFNPAEPEFHDMAREIAKFCRQQIIEIASPTLYRSTISAAEKELARLILHSENNQEKLVAIVRAVDMSRFSHCPNLDRLKNEIDAAQTVDELLRIDFIGTDFHGSDPALVPPYPSW